MTDAYSYDDGDKLVAITRGGNEYKDYTCDACGRTATISDESTTQEFSYDYEDRITSITGLGTTNSFTYNGLDTRTKKVDSGGTSNFKRVGAGVTDSVVSDGSATYTPGISERRSSTTTYLSSGLKTLDQRTNSSQTDSGTRRYDAFGAVVSSSGSWASPWGYAGKFGYQEDADAGYQLLGHRYYDASTGRFLTRDPVKDGRNWYSYCDNSPVDGVDSNGLQQRRALFIEGYTGGFPSAAWPYYEHWASDLVRDGWSVTQLFGPPKRQAIVEMCIADLIVVYGHGSEGRLRISKTDAIVTSDLELIGEVRAKLNVRMARVVIDECDVLKDKILGESALRFSREVSGFDGICPFPWNRTTIINPTYLGGGLSDLFAR